jgi:hypothetical protein
MDCSATFCRSAKRPFPPFKPIADALVSGRQMDFGSIVKMPEP